VAIKLKESEEIKMYGIEAMHTELSVEISEIDASMDEIIAYVHRVYGNKWKFDRTESRYLSCVMAIFEEV